MIIRQVDPAVWPWHQRAQRQTGTLTPSEAMELHARRKAGWTITALAVTYDIPRRTAYRYASGEYHVVEISGWRGVFHVGRDGWPLPILVGRWEPA